MDGQDDEVSLNARCDQGGNNVSYEGIDLNDMIEWVAAQKALGCKAELRPEHLVGKRQAASSRTGLPRAFVVRGPLQRAPPRISRPAGT